MALIVHLCIYRGVHWLLENPAQSLVMASRAFNNDLSCMHIACIHGFNQLLYFHNLLCVLRCSNIQDFRTCWRATLSLKYRPIWECMERRHGNQSSWCHLMNVCWSCSGRTASSANFKLLKGVYWNQLWVFGDINCHFGLGLDKTHPHVWSFNYSSW